MINLSQKGYVIQIVLIVFAILIGMMLFPMKFPKGGAGVCIVGDEPEGNEQYYQLTGLPAVAEFNGPRTAVIGGGPDPSNLTDYILIRKNVPLDSYASIHLLPVEQPQPIPGYTLNYPSSDAGKVIPLLSKKVDYDERLRYAGVIFFTNNDPASVKKVTIPNRRQAGSIEDTIIEVDVYMDKRRYPDGLGYDVENLFTCGSETALSITSVVVPAQQMSMTKDQLQLEWFKFASTGIWTMHCKPAVYLYPPEKRLVNVKVLPKGQLSYTDPPYDKEKGWTVWAEPSSHLITLANQLIPSGYLYYESKIFDSEIEKPTKGWVIKKTEMENLLNEILPKLGLNEKEANDFKSYWLTKLPESPYYFVGLVEKPQRDYLEKLDVTPKPDTSIRFSLFFEMLDEPKEVQEPVIVTPKRNGFTLVDWGGMMKLHPGTPFTCSQ